jgi:hypothetical protein
MPPRRKYKLANSAYKETDLRLYQDLIIETIESVIPGKNPQVFQNYFSTDPLTQGESILLGRELSKLPQLASLGKTITSFRLFDGKLYDNESSTTPTKKS